MEGAGTLVLAASAILLGLALLALLGPAHPSRLAAAWIAMVGFVGLASFSFWRGYQLKQSAVPVSYDLPSDPPGPHRLTLYRRGLCPGYRCRLLRRSDHRFDPDLLSKLRLCDWRITKCEHLTLSKHRFDSDGVLEFGSELSEVVLCYETTPEVQRLLSETVLELRGPAGFQKVIAQGLAMSQTAMAVYLGGLLLAAVGAGAQRRRLRRTDRPVAGP
ncbi:MAG TPA: hypothetical protein VE981_19890 [Planctomycetota bacterium]|nr:hypothetical protein [Planctomycetota bacterium]